MNYFLKFSIVGLSLFQQVSGSNTYRIPTILTDILPGFPQSLHFIGVAGKDSSDFYL